jgi:predicted transposase YbfD/YdcC
VVQQHPLTLPGRFEEHFGSLPDRRIDRTKFYPLTHVLFMALSAVLTGCNGWDAMAAFAATKVAWFRQWFDLPYGTPSADTFRRVFEMIRAQTLCACFARWVDALHDSLQGQLVAIDGKSVRGAFEQAGRTTPLHLLHVWAVEQKVLLAHQAVDGAPGEPAATEQLLGLLSLAGATVTLDANGCTQRVAAKVIEANANYVLALKGNRGPIHRATVELFAARRGRACRQRTRGHGRVETRVVRALRAEHLPERLRQHWAGLRSVVQVERTRTCGDETSHETAYYLSSLPPEPKRLASCIRAHWSVENQLHWVLDGTMGEDRCRVRDQNAAENLALMRRIALTMLRDPSAGARSIVMKQRIAGWDDAYRTRLFALGGQRAEKSA